jgi:hypothetical protein
MVSKTDNREHANKVTYRRLLLTLLTREGEFVIEVVPALVLTPLLLRHL